MAAFTSGYSRATALPGMAMAQPVRALCLMPSSVAAWYTSASMHHFCGSNTLLTDSDTALTVSMASAGSIVGDDSSAV